VAASSDISQAEQRKEVLVVKVVIGLVLGVCIGVACRVFGIPLPGPPAILGAFLAVAMATGYTVADKVLTRNAAVASTEHDSAPRAANPLSEQQQ
jgi:XapX domain-containing protein